MIKKNKKGGFSLVEMIVAIGIFTAVMFIATGALLSVVALNKKAQAQQSAINNLNFALENMTRNIRTGYDYHCENSSGWTSSPNYTQGVTDIPQDCPSGESVLVLKSDKEVTASDNGQWAFWLYDNKIFKATNLGAIANINQITADEFVIEGFRFYVVGTSNTGNGNLEQPRVRINVSGYAFVNEQTGNPRRVDFDLQTSASQRRLDI